MTLKEIKMKRIYWRYLALALAVFLIITLPACQKKEITSEPYTEASGGSGSAAGGEEGLTKEGKIGEEELEEGSIQEGTAAERAASAQEMFENEDIYYSFDSASLTPEAQEILQRKAQYLADHPHLKITVEGHCDERGTNEYNLALGEARAQSAMAYLVDLGISPSKMSAVSYGEEQPMATGASEDAWALNRRAHFVIK